MLPSEAHSMGYKKKENYLYWHTLLVYLQKVLTEATETIPVNFGVISQKLQVFSVIVLEQVIVF